MYKIKLRNILNFLCNHNINNIYIKISATEVKNVSFWNLKEIDEISLEFSEYDVSLIHFDDRYVYIILRK